MGPLLKMRFIRIRSNDTPHQQRFSNPKRERLCQAPLRYLKHAGLDDVDKPAWNIRSWWRFFFGRQGISRNNHYKYFALGLMARKLCRCPYKNSGNAIESQ